ncbi:uncharacterized protein LOC123557135 [Mercenaria mercenaria]|uniref:uncharacterized protein LOC123557135 n=1 Tax=Mercenaria mercenaria TaxID=6596 RepID=UPI00234ED969|nr:uncharacterized protein LOC123557135 [Mercenaria mercenaria]
MDDQISGKLEMLFAHLTINNVRDIKPLLFDAIDEYQSIRSNLTYDQKQKVNFIKTLLYHAEREEWNQARDQLNGAQRAYQEYMSNKTKITGYSQRLGYAQIHGRRGQASENGQLALPWKEVTSDKYMFKNEGAFSEEKAEKDSSKIRALKEEIVSHKTTSPGSSRQSKTVTRTPDEDEQGPERKTTFLNRPAIELHSRGYPGSYANQMHNRPRTLKDALEVVNERKDVNVKEAADTDGFDPNRPSRIADAYQSLYANEWKLALSAIKRAAVIEETAIECLLYILTEAYKECIDEAEAQILQFEHAALNIVTDGKYTKYDKDIFGRTGNVKHMLQYRKEVSDLSVKRLQDSFLTKTLPVIHRRYGVKKDDYIDSYSRQCIVVTWRMVIQDPPLHIDIVEPDKNIDFNHSLYRPFSKSGDNIRFLVWPVLRIYKKGPVLCQGVAQG